jgi:hypothetical protein
MMTLLLAAVPTLGRAAPGCDPALEQRAAPALRSLEAEFVAKRGPETLLLLAQAGKSSGRGLDAVNLLRAYEGMRHRAVPSLASAAQRLAIAPPPAVSELLIFGGEAMSDALVRLDGRVLGVLPASAEEKLQLLVSPGPHCLSLHKGEERSELPIDLSSERPWEVRLREGGVVTVQPTPRMALLWSAGPLSRPQQTELQRTIASAAFPELILGNQTRELGPGAALQPFLMAEPCRDHSYAPTQYVLRVAVTPQAESPRVLVLELIHTATGTVAADAHEPCTRCDVEELLTKLRRLLPPLLLHGRQREHGCLEVRTQPVGAEVRLSPVVESLVGPPSPPTLLGLTPKVGSLLRAVLTGTYEVTLTAPGYLPARRRVEVRQANPPLQVLLLPTESGLWPSTAGGPPKEPPRPLFRRFWLWQAVAAAVSVTVAGVVAAATVNR